MFLRSKIQEMILRRRSSRSMNGPSAQRGHVSNPLARSSVTPCDDDGAGSGGGKGGKAFFAAPRLAHSTSMPAGAVFGKIPAPDAETERAFSMSPTSVLDAAAAFVSSPDAGGGKRRPWRDGLHGLADVLDCSDQQEQERSVLAATSPAVRRAPLVRSFSLDRRLEFGVKNKSSWLPVRGGRESPAPAPAEPGEMEPSSEDYTCVISRGPNPRTVHIFGDRVVEAAAAAAAESSPRPINLPAPRPRGDRGFLSL